MPKTIQNGLNRINQHTCSPDRPKVALKGRSSKPLQCWGCGGNHMHYDFPHNRGDPRSLHHLEGAKIVGDIARVSPCIHIMLKINIMPIRTQWTFSHHPRPSRRSMVSFNPLVQILHWLSLSKFYAPRTDAYDHFHAVELPKEGDPS